MSPVAERPAAVPRFDLERLIPDFYTRVRHDALLGPIFDDAIHDWPHHLGQLVRFWASVVNGTGSYRGNPMAAHLKHKGRITPEMFERWLALWGETTAALLTPVQAATMQDRAQRIARSLSLGLFFRP